VGIDPFRELLGGALANLLGHLRLHHVADALRFTRFYQFSMSSGTI
jgi:hypothetical protein